MGVVASVVSHASCTAPGTGASYPHCFNLIADSAALAQFAGILAGLTFATIPILRSRTRRDDHHDVNDTMIIFVAAFISFAIATYLYVSASGEIYPDGRASFISFSASLALSVGLQQLLIGLIRLIEQLEFPGAAGFVRVVFTYGVCGLIFVYMVLTAVDSAAQFVPESTAWASPLGYSCIGLIVALIGSIGWLELRRYPGSRDGTTGAVESWRPSLLAYVALSLAAVFAYAILAAVWAEQLYTAKMPWEVYLATLVVLALLTASACSLVKDRLAARNSSKVALVSSAPDGSG